MTIFKTMTKGKVYLLAEFCDNGGFKIGVTKRAIEKRIKEAQTGNSNEIILVNSYESENYKHVEGMLHRKFGTNHKRGEWFDLTHEQVVSFTEEAKKADEIVSLLLRDNPFYN